MFVIGMCYLGLIKNIFLKQLNSKCPEWKLKSFIISQAKTNCVLAYLILIWFNEEIYGAVFGVFHT